METKTTPPLYEGKFDEDTFRRVWDRVMPDQNNSPVGVGTPRKEPGTSEPTLPETPDPVPEPSPEPEPEPNPEPQLPQVPACEEEEKPPEQNCPCTGKPELCLGEDSIGDSRRLEELMSMARRGMLAGQCLTRRCGGSCARAMSALACDHRLALRRLSAAYFLITGKRFHPNCPVPEMPASFCLSLREQFMWEQRWEHCNNQAAQATEDPCLKALYEELAQEGALHAASIRSLLEQMA